MKGGEGGEGFAFVIESGHANQRDRQGEGIFGTRVARGFAGLALVAFSAWPPFSEHRRRRESNGRIVIRVNQLLTSLCLR